MAIEGENVAGYVCASGALGKKAIFPPFWLIRLRPFGRKWLRRSSKSQTCHKQRCSLLWRAASAKRTVPAKAQLRVDINRQQPAQEERPWFSISDTSSSLWLVRSRLL